MATETRNLPRDNQPPADVPRTEQKPGKPASWLHIRLLGWGMILLSLLLMYLFLKMWPAGLREDATGSDDQLIYFFGNILKSPLAVRLSLDMRLLFMVMLAGGLGSFVHAATSFADYVGNERLTANWLWFYILRPFIGMTLAVIFYLVVRGGFLSAGTDAGKINPYGIAALAALVGMFSKQATDKLDELFTSLFRTAAGDAKRKDSLQNPVPSVTDIEPKSIEPATENVVVTVTGTGFVSGSVVQVKGINRETEFIDATKLKAKLLPEDVEEEGEIEVTVFNPGPGGGLSAAIKLKITGPDGEPPPPGDGAQPPGGEAPPPGGEAPLPGGEAPPPGGEAQPPGGGAVAPETELALTPEPDLSADPADEDELSDLDEGEGPIVNETADHELPPAKGGVA